MSITFPNAVCPDYGRLTYVNASTLKFAPFGGSSIKINGNYLDIPLAGIAGLGNTGVFRDGVAGQNLASSTTYWVYAFVNGGVVTADFRTAGHATSVQADNAGVEILIGDNSRTLIGMIHTTAGGVFNDTAADRSVLSWFNRRNRGFQGANTTGFSSGSATPVELVGASRASFLTWAEEEVLLYLAGMAIGGGAGSQLVGAYIFLNGADLAQPSYTQGTTYTSGVVTLAVTRTLTLTEGTYYYVTPAGYVSANTATFYLSNGGLLRG